MKCLIRSILSVLCVLGFKQAKAEVPYTYRLDRQGRLEEVKATASDFHYRYAYDDQGHLAGSTDLLCGASCSRVYDDQGRVIKEVFYNLIVIQYAYDSLGRRVKMELPDGSSVAYLYQEEGNLEAIVRYDAQGEEQYRHCFLEYGEKGEPFKEQLIGSAGFIFRSYDTKGRLCYLKSEAGEDAVVKRDERGNIQQTLYHHFSYNSQGALIEEDHHTYLYDDAENRIAKDGHFYALEGNRLVSAYRYDAVGNVVQKGKWLFDYDTLGRLKEITLPLKVKVAYTYDGFNRRLSKTEFYWGRKGWEKKECLYFIYDDQYEIGTVNEDGDLVEFRLLGPRQFGDRGSGVAFEKGKQVFALTHDLQGNVEALISPLDGEIVEKYTYNAFGEEAHLLNPICPWRYASKRVDALTRLVFFGQREYDPDTGRFLTPDPLKDEDGPNPYTFVHNNPISFTDLFGLESVLSQVAVWVGTVIQQYCYHFIPFPGIRNIGIYLGGLLGAEPIAEEDYQATVGFVGEEGFGEKHVGVWLHGINTNLEHTKESAKYVSRACGGIKIYYIYNATQGWASDFWDLLADKLHFRTSAGQRAFETLKQAIEDVGGVGNGGKVTVFAHSYGARIFERAAQRLSNEEQQMLEVYTFGPTAVFGLNHFISVTHTVSEKDYFSFAADPLRWVCAYIWCPNILRVSESSEGFLFENHAIYGPVYQREILHIGQRIQNKPLAC